MKLDINTVKEKLKQQTIETPSWGYADAGTRFYVFEDPSASHCFEETVEDAAQVHTYTGIALSLSIHIPWDRVDDWDKANKLLRDNGLKAGAVHPNLFQEKTFKFGSLCNPDKKLRTKAVNQIIESIEIAKQINSPIISLWLADGTSYPGQDSMRDRKQRLEESLEQVYERLPDDQRLLIEYKSFEPSFYHTDIVDWGITCLLSHKLGDKAQVLVDLGHHPLGTNIEHIVAMLLDEGKLGGFHFNNKKYADDDLTVGSINPYELFLIYNEVVEAELEGGWVGQSVSQIVYMLDQCHILKNKIAETIQSVINLQEAYAKALLVDRDMLRKARQMGCIIEAEECLRDAFNTDVRPLLKEVRYEMGIPRDPLKAFMESGYIEKNSKIRGKKYSNSGKRYNYG